MTNKIGNWKQTTDLPELIKWKYVNETRDSPYRVLVHKDNRGHYTAIFTSVFGPPNQTIRGNCGGGSSGRLIAKTAAKQFMKDHPYGCPPPGEVTI